MPARFGRPPGMKPYTPKDVLTRRTHITFTVADLLPALQDRCRPQDANAICRRDLRRYYWLLAVALVSAPAIPQARWEELLARCTAALGAETSQGDLTATLFAAADLLPIGNPHARSGWTPIQLLALADRMESVVALYGVAALAGLAHPVSNGRVKIGEGLLVGVGEGRSEGRSEGAQQKRGAA